MRRPHRSTLAAVATSTLVALVAAIGVIVVFGDDGDSDASVSTGAGDPAPTATAAGGLDLTPRDPVAGAMDVELTTFDGDPTSLADLVEAGTPTVVNFFASWCAPCVREMPAFEEVHQMVGDDVHFLGLAMQDRPEDARRTIDNTGITYDVARDVDGELIEAVGVTIMPATVFIDAEGEIVRVHPGELERDELEDAISELFGVDAT